VRKFQSPSADLVTRFDACLPKAPGVGRRQLFGCPCAFVNGNMFTGLHEQRLIVRLGDNDRAALLNKPGTEPFSVMGRTMREYVAFAAALEHTRRELSTWMKKALGYASVLPPKATSARSAAAASTARKRAAIKSKPARRRVQEKSR
jgi:TfoX/Sxy family transcriptional regulator of competence genes